MGKLSSSSNLKLCYIWRFMPGSVPEIVRIYRIIHIDNVEYALTHGMFTRLHEKADPNYINIGDTDLITKRNNYPVKVNPPNGLLGEYVPFYFGPLSPMLLKIKDGNGGITRRAQEEIVYFISRVETIVLYCPNWCFTDGHAKKAITDFYNSIEDLDEVDWNVVRQRYWSNTEDDFDRVRRKQAEFLVKDHVPVDCILVL
jgi:hypothetical protein